MVLVPVAVTLMSALQLIVIFAMHFILVITAVFMNTSNLLSAVCPCPYYISLFCMLV